MKHTLPLYLVSLALGPACFQSLVQGGPEHDAGLTDGGCGDTRFDDENCGACGRACDAGTSCAAGQCWPDECGITDCSPNQVCFDDRCTGKECVGVFCPAGQACHQGACIGSQCPGGACPPNQYCAEGTCLDPACAGVLCPAMHACEAGVCRNTSSCATSCAPPCPTCPNGRGVCTDPFHCDSRSCDAGTGLCAACDVDNPCFDGGFCVSGSCKSSLLGPCAVTADCLPATSLVCDRGLCRLTAGTCTADEQCVRTLRCELGTCGRPPCFLIPQTREVPGLVAPFSAQSTHLSTAGELFITHGQWNNGYASREVRRFLATPAAVQELPPVAPAPLVQVDHSGPVLHGYADAPGTAMSVPIGTADGGLPRFWWYPAGGPLDGRIAVEIQFPRDSGIDVDLVTNGRFLKCGQDFVIFTTTGGGPGKTLLRYRTPAPVGAGGVAQVLTSPAVRRNSWPLPDLYDLACAGGGAFWALGADPGGVKLQRLDADLQPVGTPLAISNQVLGRDLGNWLIARVDDGLLLLGNYVGATFQVLDGGVTPLSNIGTMSYFDTFASASWDTFVVYRATSSDAGFGTVTRYRRALRDGGVPPIDLDCSWQ